MRGYNLSFFQLTELKEWLNTASIITLLYTIWCGEPNRTVSTVERLRNLVMLHPKAWHWRLGGLVERDWTEAGLCCEGQQQWWQQNRYTHQQGGRPGGKSDTNFLPEELFYQGSSGQMLRVLAKGLPFSVHLSNALSCLPGVYSPLIPEPAKWMPNYYK